ncbi:MAG: aldehyde ferredoxin oxidoreductase family protein [Candidatus Thermoplasmatota archaeon]|nr:aldehyde ferredoxin oxidoreductase family protein [Candidatus Thermoplasmatota archaeon]
MFGYTGKLLEVDLTTSKTKIFDIDEELFKKFIGGKGLGTKILYDSLKPGVDSLSPENLLIFATGPLTGLALPSSGCFSVITKSPLTNIFYCSVARGNLGTRLKQAGFDILVVKGSSSSPVFLEIEDNDCKIIGALDLWRKNIYQTEKILKDELGRNFAVAAIGISGEKFVRCASINVDSYGQCIAGAVMGSKNLKAIAVNGKNKLRYYDFDKFKFIARNIFKKVKIYKSKASSNKAVKKNSLPTKNFQSSSFECSYKLSEEFQENITTKTKGCYLCQLKCLRHFFVKNEKYKCECLAFNQTLAMLGSNWLIRDIAPLAYASYLCNDYGLDASSICNVVGFVMECSEKNFISSNINFSDDDATIELIKKIARRENIGNELAEGVKRYSERINAAQFGAQVKGLEMFYDARYSPAIALAYITSDTCEIPETFLELDCTGYSPEALARVVKCAQDNSSVSASLVLCELLPLEMKDFFELTNAATGLELDESEYLKIGERIWNLARLFNTREGISRKDDTLPKRFTEEPLRTSDGKELIVKKDELDKMLEDYYMLRNWDENGIPKKEKLVELELI